MKKILGVLELGGTRTKFSINFPKSDFPTKFGLDMDSHVTSKRRLNFGYFPRWKWLLKIQVEK